MKPYLHSQLLPHEQLAPHLQFSLHWHEAESDIREHPLVPSEVLAEF